MRLQDLPGRQRRGGHEDHEGDAVDALGHHRWDDPDLTVADQSDAASIDIVPGAEHVDRRFNIAGTILEDRLQAVARGATDAPDVEPQ